MWFASTRALYLNPCIAAELLGMPYFLSPMAPWVMVPAKYTPGTDALSQYGVCAGSRSE